MTTTGAMLLAVSFVLLTTTARGQERRKFAPVRATSEPVAASTRFDGGIVPVEVRTSFDFQELNDEFEPGRDARISVVDGIERLLDTRSPAPTTKWARFSPTPASGAGFIDPQIAASNSMVGVVLWDTIDWYDKSWTLLPSTPTFPNPTSTEALFKPLTDWLDSTANLNPSVVGDSTFLFANGQVGDARIAWDPQRHRFLILGTAKNNAAHPSATAAEAISQRRTKFIFAISKTSDPHDGFNTWAFNGTPNDGACNSTSDAAPCPDSSFIPGDAGDYPSIGISGFHYVFTTHVEHASVDGITPGYPRTSYIVSVNAAAAASGNTAGLHGHGFWEFNYPKIDPSEPDARSVSIIATAVQRGPLPGGDGNLLAQVVNQGGSKRMATYFITPTDPPQLFGQALDLPSTIGYAINAPQPSPGQPVNYGSNLSSNIITAYWRGGILYTSFADCVRFADMSSGCADAVHIVKFQADANTVSYDGGVIFGERNPLDEPPGTVNHYAFPGTAVNKHDDLVATYTRSGVSLPPEARYSVWYNGEPRPRPSNVLQAGTGNQPSNGDTKGYRDDTAGVAVDPFDDTAIWISHSYANSGSVGWAVGKVFGSPHFDLSVENIGVLQEVAAVGGTARGSFLTVNRGDGDAPGARADVMLVDGTDRPRRVLTTRIEPLTSAAAKGTDVTFTIARELSPGLYHVCVVLNPDGGEREYSDDNNRGCSSSALRVVSRIPTDGGR